MLTGLLFSFLIIIIYLLFSEVKINYVYNVDSSVIISFSVFELVLSDFKKKNKLGLFKKLSKFSIIKIGIEYYLRKADAAVNAIYSNNPEGNYPKNAIRYFGTPLAAISALFAYLDSHSKSFKVDNESVLIMSDETLPRSILLDIEASSKMYHLIFTIIKILIKKSKMKKERAGV